MISRGTHGGIFKATHGVIVEETFSGTPKLTAKIIQNNKSYSTSQKKLQERFLHDFLKKLPLKMLKEFLERFVKPRGLLREFTNQFVQEVCNRFLCMYTGLVA